MLPLNLPFGNFERTNVHPMNPIKRLQRFFSGVMAVTFFVTSTCISVPAAHAAEVSPLNTFTIPAEFGRVTEIIPQSKDGSLLIHIQEAHANFDAQQNIKSILQYLSDHYGIKLVFLEGAGNKLKPELLNFFPKDTELQKAANLTLLKAGELTGAEVFMIDQASATRGAQGATEKIDKNLLSAPEAYGVENAEAYAKDLEAFRVVCEGRAAADKFLGSFYREWQKQASREFNKDLREFLAQYVAFGEGKLPLNDWLEILRKTSREFLDLNLEDVRSQLEWPILVRYFRLKQIGGKIDASKLEIEKKKFFDEVSILEGRNGMNDEEKQSAGSIRQPSSIIQEVAAVFESAKKHDLPAYKTRFVFERLMDALPENFSFDLYPNLRLQIQQMILLSELQNDPLQNEIKELAKRLVGALAKTEEERLLTEVFREYQMIQKLFHLELSREEYQQVKARGITPSRLLRGMGEGERKAKVASDLSSPLSVSPEIQKLYRIALDFYSGAIVREGHMMQRTREIMAKRKQTQAVLITGGFHTEGLKERVLASGSSYINITPNISEVTKEDQRNYLRALLGTQPSLRGGRKSSFGSRGLDESEIGASLASDGAFIKTLPNGRRFLALRLTDIRRFVGAYLTEKFSNQRRRSQEYMEVLDQGIQRVIQDAVGMSGASLQPVLRNRSEVRETAIFVGAQSAKLDSQNRIQLRTMFSKMVEKGAPIIGMPEKDVKELRIYPLETWQKLVAANRPQDVAEARKYDDQIHRDAFIFKMDGQGRINLSEPIRRGFLDNSVGSFEFVGAGDSFLIKSPSRSEVREVVAPETAELEGYTVVSRQLEAGLDRGILEALNKKLSARFEGLGYMIRRYVGVVACTTLTGGLGALMHDLFPSWAKNFGDQKGKSQKDVVAINVIYEKIKGQNFAIYLPDEVRRGKITLGDYLRSVLKVNKGLELSFELEIGDDFRRKAAAEEAWAEREGSRDYKEMTRNAKQIIGKKIHVDVYPTETYFGQAPNYYIDAYYRDENGDKIRIFDEVYPDAPHGHPNLWRDVHMAVYGWATQHLTKKLQEKGVVKDKILFVNNEVFVSTPTPLFPEAVHHHINHTVFRPGLYMPDEASYEMFGYPEIQRKYLLRNGRINIVDAVGISSHLITGVALYEHTPVLADDIMAGNVHKLKGYNVDGVRNTNGVYIEQWQLPGLRTLISAYKSKLGFDVGVQDRKFFEKIQEPAQATLLEEFKRKAEFAKAVGVAELFLWLKEDQNSPDWFNTAVAAYRTKTGLTVSDDAKFVEDFHRAIEIAMVDPAAWETLNQNEGFVLLRDFLLKTPVITNVRRQVSYKGPDKWLELLRGLRNDPAALKKYREDAPRVIIGGREFGDEAHWMFIEIRGLVEEMHLQDKFVTPDDYNIYIAPTIFGGVSGAVMLSDEFLEASATSMMKAMTNMAALIGVWGGADPELFTIVEVASGKTRDVFKDKITHDQLVAKLKTGEWKIENGFLIDYSTTETSAQYGGGRRPSSESLLQDLYALAGRFQDPRSRRDLQFNVLTSTPAVDMAEGQALAHKRLWAETIRIIRETDSFFEGLKISVNDAKAFLSKRLSQPWQPEFTWQYMGEDLEKIREISGILGFVEGFRYLRMRGKVSYGSIAHHAARGENGDIFAYLEKLFEGFDATLTPVILKVRALAERAKASQDIREKVKANLEALEIMERLTVELSYDLFKQYVTAKDRSLEPLLANPVVRENLVRYFDEHAIPFGSIDKKIRGYAITVNGQNYVLAIDAGAYVFSYKTGKDKARSSFYGQAPLAEVVGKETASDNARIVQVLDAISGENYGKYPFWKLEEALPVGIPYPGIQLLQLGDTNERSEEQAVRLRNDVLQYLEALTNGRLVSNGVPVTKLLFQKVKNVIEDPVKMAELLKGIASLSREEAIQKFGEKGTSPVMAFVTVLAPGLLPEMKAWNPEVYEKLNVSVHQPDLEKLFSGGSIWFHRVDRDSALVISRSLADETAPHVIVPIHFPGGPYDHQDGKAWFRLLDVNHFGIRNSEDASYQVYDAMLQVFYPLLRSGAKLFRERWPMGVPMEDRRDRSGYEQKGYRFQILVMKPLPTESTRSEARETSELLKVPVHPEKWVKLGSEDQVRQLLQGLLSGLPGQTAKVLETDFETFIDAPQDIWDVKIQLKKGKIFLEGDRDLSEMKYSLVVVNNKGIVMVVTDTRSGGAAGRVFSKFSTTSAEALLGHPSKADTSEGKTPRPEDERKKAAEDVAKALRSKISDFKQRNISSEKAWEEVAKFATTGFWSSQGGAADASAERAQLYWEAYYEARGNRIAPAVERRPALEILESMVSHLDEIASRSGRKINAPGTPLGLDAPRSEARSFSLLNMTGMIVKTPAEFFKINSVQGGSEKAVWGVSEKIMDGIIPLFAHTLNAAKFLISGVARVPVVPSNHVEAAKRVLGLAPDVSYSFVLGSDLALRKGMIEIAKTILKESVFAILVKNDPAMVAKAEALIKKEGLGDRVFVITDVKLARAKISKPGAALRGLISSDELMLAEELKDELKNDLIVMNKSMQERFLNAAGQLFQSLADKIAAQFSLARSA